MQQSQTRPRCDRQDGGIILNLRGVNLNSDGPADEMVALRIWVTDKTLITVRVRKVFALDELRTACLNNQAPPTTMAFLLHLSHALTRRVQDVVFDLADRVEQIEDDQSDQSISLPPDMGELRRNETRFCG